MAEAKDYDDLELQVGLNEAILRTIIMALCSYDANFLRNVLDNLTEDTITAVDGQTQDNLRRSKLLMRSFRQRLIRDMQDANLL